MCTETTNSLVNLGNLSKPANTLRKKIADATGGIFKPWQIKRVAKAEANLIRAQGEIEVSEVMRRAMQRFLDEETEKQKNIETITVKALPDFKENSAPENMDDDWITNFFDKCRIVSNEGMQYLWAKVLAGEANEPGKYSRRTVNFLSEIDKQDADCFMKLCSFVIKSI